MEEKQQAAEAKDDVKENTTDNLAAKSDQETVESEKQPEAEVNPEQRLIEELAAANDKYLRLYAEFDNYKRRTAKERIELMQTAGREIIANLLPVLDDFERALKAFETTTELEPLKEGVALVSQKLKNILTQQGLQEMEDSTGKPFDDEFQEAITNVPAPNDELKGKVIDQIQKGYLLNGKVLRYAKVVVGS